MSLELFGILQKQLQLKLLTGCEHRKTPFCAFYLVTLLCFKATSRHETLKPMEQWTRFLHPRKGKAHQIPETFVISWGRPPLPLPKPRRHTVSFGRRVFSRHSNAIFTTIYRLNHYRCYPRRPSSRPPRSPLTGEQVEPRWYLRSSRPPGRAPHRPQPLDKHVARERDAGRESPARTDAR